MSARALALAVSLATLACTQPREPRPVREPAPAAREPAPAARERPENELALAPLPVAVSAPSLTASADPADPAAVRVRGACEVRVAEVRGDAAGAGARARARIAARGAVFAQDVVAGERWALVYEVPGATPAHGLELGLVSGGRAFACSAEVADVATLACGVTICATLHPL